MIALDQLLSDSLGMHGISSGLALKIVFELADRRKLQHVLGFLLALCTLGFQVHLGQLQFTDVYLLHLQPTCPFVHSIGTPR